MSEIVSMRKAYGEALIELGKNNDKVVVLSADVSNSDHSYMFEEAFPDRFYNVGIAEQSLVDIAVGLSHTGFIPFVNTFSFLFATRALEMIRTHLCYGKANVKLMGAYSGLSDSFDGPTHHSITDIAIMRSLPNMSVVVPGDSVAIKKIIPLIADWDGPLFLRISRAEVPILFNDNYKLEIGKAIVIREGNDLTIICAGIMISRSLKAADVLLKDGISARVVELHTIKPIDKKSIICAAKETGAIVTAEEHNILGGLGSAVSEVITDKYPVPIKRVGIDDKFSETGPYEVLLDKYGMSVDDIILAAKEVVGLKKYLSGNNNIKV